MREMTFTDAAREGLAEEMAQNPGIFVMGEGVGTRGGNFNTTVGLYDLYGPKRLRDTPICERGFTGLCTGAAMVGAHPVVDFMFIDFELDAIGELFNQTSRIQYMSSGRLQMPILVRGSIGIFGSAGPHHSGNYYPLLMHVPGFRVVVPTTPADAKGLIKTALRSTDPVIFLEHKGLLFSKGPVPEGELLVPFGKASITREGTDVTVVAVALMVQKTLEAAKQLEQEGVSCEVIDPRTLAPLDVDTIRDSVHKTGRLLIVDEDWGPCGIGAEIAARIVNEAFDDLDAPISRLNGAFAPTPYSPSLTAGMVPNAQTIAQAIRDLLAE